MKAWIAFFAVFLLFNLFGGTLYSVATSPLSGMLYWTALFVLGAATGQKAFNCFSDDAETAS